MNCLVIAGNVGKDAELRTTQNSKDVASFSVAVSNGKDRDATWFDCSLWGERGKKLAQYIRKGDKITVMGEVSAREHNGKAYLQVFVRELTLQGGKPSGDEGGQHQGSGSGQSSYGSGGTPMDDSEIPFAPEWRA